MNQNEAPRNVLVSHMKGKKEEQEAKGINSVQQTIWQNYALTFSIITLDVSGLNTETK